MSEEVDLAVRREEIRTARALSTVANEQCSCGGRPADDPEACPACLYYHAVMDMLGIEWQVGA